LEITDTLEIKHEKSEPCFAHKSFHDKNQLVWTYIKVNQVSWVLCLARSLCVWSFRYLSVSKTSGSLRQCLVYQMKTLTHAHLIFILSMWDLVLWNQLSLQVAVASDQWTLFSIWKPFNGYIIFHKIKFFELFESLNNFKSFLSSAANMTWVIKCSECSQGAVSFTTFTL
jgi:hypothetical protein